MQVMARSIRVEAYLDPETVREIDERTDNRSDFIRKAVKDRLALDQTDTDA